VLVAHANPYAAACHRAFPSSLHISTSVPRDVSPLGKVDRRILPLELWSIASPLQNALALLRGFAALAYCAISGGVARGSTEGQGHALRGVAAHMSGNLGAPAAARCSPTVICALD
jgi:hypothetical protein